MTLPHSVLRTNNVSDKSSSENQNTFYIPTHTHTHTRTHTHARAHTPGQATDDNIIW
jgi:hypothetical protein